MKRSIKFPTLSFSHIGHILRLGYPILLANAGQMIVQIVDTIMVGHIDSSTPETASLAVDSLAAVGFVSPIFTCIMVLGLGFSFGLTPLIGEFHTKGEHRITAGFFQNSALLNTAIGTGLALILGVGYFFLDNMGQSPSVVELSYEYYIYLTISLIPFMIFYSFKQFLEGLGNTKASMVVTILSNLLNILLNYLLIYGNFGFPRMDAAGAGLATLISRIAMPIMFLLFFLKRDSYKRYFSFFSSKAFDMKRIKLLGKIGVPISGQMFMEVSAFSIAGIMMGWISAESQAANHIATQMGYCAFMIVSSIASAATISASHSYGRNDITELRRVASSSYFIMSCIIAISVVAFIVFREQIATLFIEDPNVRTIAAQLLIMAGIFQISDGVQALTIGLLRGVQDVNGPLKVAFFSYIVINIPLGYLCAFTFNMGPIGLWIGFIFGLTCAAILLRIRFNKFMRRFERKIVALDSKGMIDPKR